jgi:protein involved in polysaccharide export with SLBB domain
MRHERGALAVMIARLFLQRLLPLVLLAAIALGAAASAMAQSATAAASAAPAAAPTEISPDYKLGTGDKVHVTVFGEEDLSGDFEIDGSGFLRMPLIGEIKAAGLSIRDFEAQLSTMLNDGYLKDAKVSVQITSYRPFYIYGEVNKPGEYPFVNEMTVPTAIALAGGYTYRADSSDVYIQRSGSQKEVQAPATQATKIGPGDIVRVPESFF